MQSWVGFVRRLKRSPSYPPSTRSHMASNADKIREWSIRLKKFERSNSSLSQFCRDEQVSIPSFYYWQNRVDNSSTRTPVVPPVASTVDHATKPIDHVDASSSCMRFIMHVGSIKVECHADSVNAINTFLDWASRHQEHDLSHRTNFQQLIGNR